MDSEKIIRIARRWEELQRKNIEEMFWPENPEREKEQEKIVVQLKEAGFKPSIDEWNELVLTVKAQPEREPPDDWKDFLDEMSGHLP